jgi:hypothetical protein
VRVAFVDTYYPAFLLDHYRARPGLAREPYDVQHAALMERRFGTSDAYSVELRRLGHEAHDLVANCLPLQRRWAEEHGLGALARAGALARGPARGRWLVAVLRRQLRTLDPGVVYLQDLNLLGRGDLDALRAAGRLVAGQIASRLPGADVLGGYDLVLTSFPHFVGRLRAMGMYAEYLPIAFDTAVTRLLGARGVSTDPAAERPHALTFVGGLDPRVHGRGVGLLERLARRLPLEAWGYGASALAPDSPLRERYNGHAWGLDMYEVLARSRLTVNRHIDAAEGHANNMRLYEATGAGAALATEAAPNLPELFAPGREVVAYAGEDELVAALQRLLGDDAERRRIAAAGQARTLREHTYAERLGPLARLLESRLPALGRRRRPPLRNSGDPPGI